MIFNIGGIDNPEGKMPEFTYGGTYRLVDDGKVGSTQNWQIEFLTSGEFTPKKKMTIDVTLVGGGGGSRPYSGGGGGGYVIVQKTIVLEAGKTYQIVIGDGGAAINEHVGGAAGGTGGTTSAFDLSAAGGNGGVANNNSNNGVGGKGGSGGGGYSGGQGGTDGADGKAGGLTNEDGSPRTIAGGKGSGKTTRSFGEESGTLYASGGDGCYATTWVKQNAAANTGNGAPGGAYKGGSGIVVIRNAR